MTLILYVTCPANLSVGCLLRVPLSLLRSEGPSCRFQLLRVVLLLHGGWQLLLTVGCLLFGVGGECVN